MGLEVLGATSNLISTVGSSFGLVPTTVKVPAPNVLSNYASYTYVISLQSLTTNELDFPDQSYIAGKVLPIICKSAMADPLNRIQTPNFGKQDFFIDNLVFESFLGGTSRKTTSLATVQFDVIEPYSIGLFINALQMAALKANHSNWRDAPFLLSVEFRGNTENGQIKKVPFSTRHIPIRLSMVTMNSTGQGTRYLINAYATQGQALTTEYANIKNDITIKGKTIQEILQTGEQSLQTVINKKYDDLVKQKKVKVADRVVILFPQETATSKAVSSAASGGASTGPNKAYMNPQASKEAQIYKKLGITENSLQQSASTVNKIGSCTMGYDASRRPDPPTKNSQDTWDPVLKIWLRGKLVSAGNEGSFKFTQETDIPTIINQVILSSSYADQALSNIENGFVTWWRVDTQVYYIDTNENIDDTGKKPKIAVYRVTPFKVHMSKTAGPGANTDGTDIIKATAVKRYDYIFTGKNTEVLNFKIDYNVGFANSYFSDSFLNSMGIARQDQESTGDKKENAAVPESQPKGQPVSGDDKAGQRAMQNSAATSNSQDGVGGGGQEGAIQRLGKSFHEAITNPFDMVMLDLEILGDPYWFVTSGMGNYIAEPVPGVKDLNKDGSVNWQTSQVHCVVNFRTPIDINQVTGMYNFGGPNHMDMTKDPKAGPAIGFSGAYCVNIVSNNFRDGSFRQTLKGFRVNGQEYKKIADDKKNLNSKNSSDQKPSTI